MPNAPSRHAGSTRMLYESSHAPEPAGGPPGRVASDAAPRILVVDDEDAIRTICRVNLEAVGMTVLEAGDGEKALTLVRELRPELVLLDVMMPRVDGWAVATRIAATAETRDIPVVFLSARADADDRRKARELGAVGYIIKPFDPLSLGDALTSVLDRLARGERAQLQAEVCETS